MSQNIMQQDTFENITADNHYIICCFFTESYRSHALSLKDSLDTLDLSYYIVKVEDAGYWEANTRIKPHFVLQCLQKFPNKDILYLDADALVKKPLDYFNTVTADVAFYKTRGMEGMSHDYLASTMFFKNSEPTRALVKQWIAEQEGGKRTQVDQDSLDAAMLKFEGKLIVEPLPAGYIKIFDRDYDGEIYIEQYQASRGQTKLRRQNIRKRNRLIGAAVGSLILLTTCLVMSSS